MEQIPKILYKYRQWNNEFHKHLLTDNEIFLASPANLNDPFDASMPFRYDPKEMTPENITQKLLTQGRLRWPNISEEELHQRAYVEQFSGRFANDEYWKDQHSKIKENLHRSFGLLSLTKHRDNLLMWAHYADSHKGFCVGIDTEHLFETVGGAFGPVIYQDDFPFLPLLTEEGQDIETMIRMLNTKSPHWGYEDEFRLTKHGASNVSFKLKPDAIAEVILGCNISKKDQVEIIKVLDERLPNTKIFQATTNSESFKLDINSAITIKI